MLLSDKVRLPVVPSIIANDNFGLLMKSLTVGNELPDIPKKSHPDKRRQLQNKEFSRNSLPRQENTELHYTQNYPRDHTTPGRIEFYTLHGQSNTPHGQSNSSPQSGYKPPSHEIKLKCHAVACNMGDGWDPLQDREDINMGGSRTDEHAHAIPSLHPHLDQPLCVYRR